MEDTQRDTDLKLHRLRAELERERLIAELRTLRDGGPPKRKSLRRVVGEWLIGGGALLSALGIGVDYAKDDDARAETARLEACKRAHDAINDDGYNRALNPREADYYKRVQLKIVDKCSRDALR